MIVNFKKLHEDAVLPSYAKPGDAGLDITAISDYILDDHGNMVYSTGLSVEIPGDHVGLLFPRSSISKKDLSLANSVGVIDSGYRGEILFKFKIIDADNGFYRNGDRIGQLVILPYPKVRPTWVEELSNSERGISGFGDSGN